MERQFEMLRKEIESEIVMAERSIQCYEVIEDIEAIIANNGGINRGIVNFEKFAKELKEYIEVLPTHIAEELHTINNLAIAIIEYKEPEAIKQENTEEENYEFTEENGFYVAANIEF